MEFLHLLLPEQVLYKAISSKEQDAPELLLENTVDAYLLPIDLPMKPLHRYYWTIADQGI
jgi:hypothetical protein